MIVIIFSNSGWRFSILFTHPALIHRLASFLCWTNGKCTLQTNRCQQGPTSITNITRKAPRLLYTNHHWDILWGWPLFQRSYHVGSRFLIISYTELLGNRFTNFMLPNSFDIVERKGLSLTSSALFKHSYFLLHMLQSHLQTLLLMQGTSGCAALWRACR